MNWTGGACASQLLTAVLCCLICLSAGRAGAGNPCLACSLWAWGLLTKEEEGTRDGFSSISASCDTGTEEQRLLLSDCCQCLTSGRDTQSLVLEMEQSSLSSQCFGHTTSFLKVSLGRGRLPFLSPFCCLSASQPLCSCPHLHVLGPAFVKLNMMSN